MKRITLGRLLRGWFSTVRQTALVTLLIVGAFLGMDALCGGTVGELNFTVLLLAIGAVMLSAQRLSLSSAAAQMARHEARGDAAAAAAVFGGLSMRGGVAVHRSGQGQLHCVTLSATPVGGALSVISVTGRGCAAVSEAGS